MLLASNLQYLFGKAFHLGIASYNTDESTRKARAVGQPMECDIATRLFLRFDGSIVPDVSIMTVEADRSG